MKIAFMECAGSKLPPNRIILSCYCYCAQIAGIKFGERKLRIHKRFKAKKENNIFEAERREREAEKKERKVERQRDRQTERKKDKKEEGKGVLEGIPQIEKFVQNRMYCM